MKLVQFGAGNIGRSFIGQIFSRAGWDVVFVDVGDRLVNLLNEKRYYTVVIKRDSAGPGAAGTDEVRRVGPVRAVNGKDAAAAAKEIAGADIVVTSVGKAALPKILPVIAGGLAERRLQKGDIPLDIIIAENDREAPELFRTVLGAELGLDYPLDTLAGLVETSIGKMVPIMKAADLAEDPLQLFAEEYETLIVDKKAFRGPLPDIPSIHPVDPIAAYVDRKLFIHNLGHAAAAYFGCAAFAASGSGGGGETDAGHSAGNSMALAKKSSLAGQTTLTIPEALALPGMEENVRRAMNEAAAALLLEYSQSKYPGSYNAEDMASHIDDLVFRFKNRALGDTVHRVGRDLRRKLARQDRITGAMLLCAKHRLPFGAIAKVYRAALEFAAPTEDGTLFPADKAFRETYGLDSGAGTGGGTAAPGSTAARAGVIPGALERIAREVSALDNSRAGDALIIQELRALF